MKNFALKHEKALEKRKDTLSKRNFEKVCDFCGKKFATPYGNKKYCSGHCAMNFYRENFTETAFYKMRFNVFKRDSFRCIYCGRSPIEDGIKLEVDHLNPRNGKSEDWKKAKMKDLVSSCKDCNIGKRNYALSLPVLGRIRAKIDKS